MVRGAHLFGALLVCAALPALACPYPDEGNMPLRRALTRVQMLPDTMLWEKERREAGELVQYELSLEETMLKDRKCYWTVRAISNGSVWKRFFVSPDGKSVLTGTADPPRHEGRSPGDSSRSPAPLTAK